MAFVFAVASLSSNFEMKSQFAAAADDVVRPSESFSSLALESAETSGKCEPKRGKFVNKFSRATKERRRVAFSRNVYLGK